jgi:hypothetical protein
MRTTVTCGCGALYEREIHKLKVRERKAFKCLDCSKTLESWSGFRVPDYRKIVHVLIKRPQ